MALFHRRLALLATAAVGVAGFQPFLATSANAAGLPAPSSLAPDQTGADPTDAGNAQQKDPVLSWSPVAGATGYAVELSRSDDWTDGSVKVDLPDGGRTGTAMLALPQTLQHGDYFWHVRARAGSTLGPWSSDAQLYRGWDDAPVIGPDPGSDSTVDPASNAVAPWRFSWQAVPDASSYQVELSSRPTFPSPAEVGKDSGTIVCLTDHTTFTPYSSEIGEDANVDDCTIDHSVIADGTGTTYWRVRAIDDSDADAPSGASESTLACFGVGQGGDLSAVTTDIALGTPASTSQECSQWSSTGTVQTPVVGDGDIDVSALTAPAVTLSCATCTDMPEISWDPVDRATSYRVTVATDPEGTSILRVYHSNYLTLTSRDQLPDASAGNGYWVFVQACTTATGVGQVEGCGAITRTSFKKVTPGVNGLGSADVPGGVVLSWNDLANRYAAALAAPGLPSVEAVNYRIQVTKSGDTGFANPVVSVNVDRSCDVAGGATCYQPPSSSAAGKAQFVLDAVKNGDYLWRVTPFDLSGNHLPAAESTVTVDSTGPVFRLTDGDGLPVNGVLHITGTDAGPIQGVDATSLHVVSATTGNAVAGSLQAAADGQHWTFDPSRSLVTGERYTLSVTSAITDTHGNFAVVKGTPVRTTRLADDRSSAWNYTRGWTRHASSNAVRNTYSSAPAGKSATVKVHGSSVTVLGCRGPHFGTVKVSVDGQLKATVNEHRAFTGCDVVLWKGSVSSDAVHTVKVSAVGAGAIDAVRVG